MDDDQARALEEELRELVGKEDDGRNVEVPQADEDEDVSVEVPAAFLNRVDRRLGAMCQ
jgi:hypothetical protein